MDPLRRARVALCTTPGDRLVVHYCASPVMVPTAGQQTSGSTAQSLGAFSVGPVVSAVAGVPVGRWGPPRSGGSTVFSAPVTAVIALAPGDALLADLFGFPTAYTVLAVLTLLGSVLVVAVSGRTGALLESCAPKDQVGEAGASPALTRSRNTPDA
jgi:hypothetical protein